MKHFKLFLGLGLFSLSANAQQNFTLYPMQSIPQSNLLNVANAPDCKWHIGIPALNSFYGQYSNGGFNLKKIFDALEPSSGDSFKVNFNKVLDVMAKKNYIAFKFENTWLHGGFQFGNHYFHLNATEKVQFRTSIPKDLLRFIIDGNGGDNLGQTFRFDLKADAVHYREYGIGYNYKLDEKFTFGGRVKYLQGFNTIHTRDAHVDVTTMPEDYSLRIKANVELNTASAWGEIIPIDTNKVFSGENVTRSGNRGMALDLGASMKVNDKLTVSASILDMGYIRWRENVVNMVSKNPNAEYHFDGIHIKSSDTQDFDQYMKQIADSLIRIFGLDTTHTEFSSALSTEFFIYGSYQLSEKISAGALFYGDFYNKRFYPGLTLNMQFKLGRALSFNLTNTMYNRSFLNVGLGTSLNLGPVQFYSVFDNVLMPFAITSLKSFSWRFGSNLTFGRPKKKKTPDADTNAAPAIVPGS